MTNQPKSPDVLMAGGVVKTGAPSHAPATANPAAQAEALTQTVVSSLMDKMRQELQRKGTLKLADINAIIIAETAELTTIFQQTLVNYADVREADNWDEKREYPFDRLIVKRFSSLFKEPDLSRPDRVSRRMLPGFFIALGMILGPEAIDKYQQQCRLIVGRIHDEKGHDFNWEEVYAAKDARTLLLDAMVEIAIRFEDFDHRTRWFVEMINANLTPSEDASQDDADWNLSPAGVKNFLNTLLDDLRRVLATEPGKRHITKRHGAGAVTTIEHVLGIVGR